MLKDIDTSTVSKFTISTNESSCLVMGCIRRNIGRGILVWSSLNNATCYFNSGTATCLMKICIPISYGSNVVLNVVLY